MCTGRVVTPENCLGATNPELAAEWHPTKNESVVPSAVHARSSRKVWWQCSRCQYEWQAAISRRVKGSGCRACAGQIVTTETCLANARPELVSEWHPTRNAPVTPLDVHHGSSKAVWWRCAHCAYEWQTPLRARSQGAGCPACGGRPAGHRSPARPRVVTAKNCLTVVDPELARDWHPAKNGRLNPSEVHARSSWRVWWQCQVCGHEWEATVGQRARGTRRCPLCSGRVLTAPNLSSRARIRLWPPNGIRRETDH